MAMFDNWEDEDCWLTPSRDAPTQPEKFDINVFLSDVKLSENAGALSKKIARAQQRRAMKTKKLEPLTEEKRELSASPTPPTTHSLPSVVLGADTPTSVTFVLKSQPLKSISEQTPVELKRLSSTPKSHYVAPLNNSSGFLDDLSPVCAREEEDEEEDECFEDASDHFSDQAMERISMSSSFSTIEALLSKEEGEDLGQSLIRAPMSKSLVKVEEEEIPRSEIFDNSPRNFRSTSVSPRPLVNNDTTPVTVRNSIKPDVELQPRLSSRIAMERRSLGSASILRNSRSHSRTPGNVGFSLIATANGRQSRAMRSVKQPPKPNVVKPNSDNVVTHNESSSPRPILTLHADLAALDDFTRRQEEELRQEVLMQQQAERKTSWQGETNSVSSANSSMTSLASSKSADIATIASGTTLQSRSRLRAPSKLPRPTNRFTNTHKTFSTARPNAAMEKSRSSVDDECF